MRRSRSAGLVGRARERAALASALERLDRGERVGLAVTGEIGIGKTALLDELSGSDGGGRTVLAGRAVRSERDRPLALFVDALASQLPSLPDAAERRGAAAVRSLVRELAAQAPVVLVLDDVQWADGASLRLIGELIQDPSVRPVMIALGYRPRRFPAALETALASFVVLRPRRLGRGEADRLLRELDPATRSAVRRESAGNPFFLRELARADRSPTALPPAVAAAVGEELADLGRAARTLVQAAAVVDDPGDGPLVDAVSELNPDERRAAVEELRQHGLISGSPIAFVHPLIQRGVRESSGPGWRIAAHRRAAAFLARRPGSVVARARHLERSAAPGDVAAVDVMRRAAELSDGRRDWLEAAVRFRPGDDRLELLRELAQAQRAAGATSASRATLLRALELLPRGPEGAIPRGAVVADLARLEHDQLEWGVRRAAMESALRDFAGTRSAVLGALELELAVDHWIAGELEAAATHARRAAGDDVASAEAALLQLLDRARSSPRSLESAADAVGSLTDAELAARVRATVLVAHAGRILERMDLAGAALERGLKVSRNGSPWRALIHVQLGEIAVFHGRLTDADAAADAALQEAGSAVSIASVSAWSLRSRVSRLRGDLAEAVAAAERGVQLAERAPAPLAAAARCALGAALIESGASRHGIDEVLRAAGGPELALIEPACRASWYETLASAELDGGRYEEAERWVRRCERSVPRFDRSTRTAVALRARAALVLARGDLDGAADRAREAATRFDSGGAALEAARSRVLLGRAYARAGDSLAAAEALHSAHHAFATAGAARYRDHAARELRRLGRRTAHPVAATRNGSGIASLLSPREHQVARLAAAGRTNRAIAAELFLSEKTVETYLSRAFGKLDVSSRTALARVLHETGA